MWLCGGLDGTGPIDSQGVALLEAWLVGERGAGFGVSEAQVMPSGSPFLPDAKLSATPPTRLP